MINCRDGIETSMDDRPDTCYPSNVTPLHTPALAAQLAGIEVISDPDHDGGDDERCDTHPYQALRTTPGLGPFPERKSLQRSEDNDAGHM